MRSSCSGDRPFTLVGLGQRLTVDHEQRRVEQEQEPGSAGIDDAGVLQHGELLGSVVERGLAGGARGTEHSHQAGSVGRGGGGGVGRFAHDGQDRALDRLEHRQICGRRCRLQRFGDLRGREIGGVLQRADQPAQDLAEDHTAVAACPHQAAVADGIAGRLQLEVGQVELGDHGIERSGHVGAGVAVGNRVDVEPIDALGVDLQGVAEGDDRAAQRFRAEPFQCGHADRLGAPRRVRPARRPGRTPKSRALTYTPFEFLGQLSGSTADSIPAGSHTLGVGGQCFAPANFQLAGNATLSFTSSSVVVIP